LLFSFSCPEDWDVRVIDIFVFGIGSTGFSYFVLLLLYTDEISKILGGMTEK